MMRRESQEADRHQGFILWGDMDIAIPRKAFNRFCKLAAPPDLKAIK